MSDTPHERNSNSKSNLIEVQHVGVTAKLQSPLINLYSSSSSEALNGNQAKYNKLTNDTQVEVSEDISNGTNASDVSRILYEMRSINPSANNRMGGSKGTPSKIEFQLYRRPTKCMRHHKIKHIVDANKKSKRKTSKRKLFNIDTAATTDKDCNGTISIEHTLCQRMRQSLDGMRLSKANGTKIIDDRMAAASTLITSPQSRPRPTATIPPPPPSAVLHRDTSIGIYPFEYGCADYLRTTDCHPQLLSVELAERATHYATRFWAEFFGSLHIGVAFVVTFILQSYRFMLYSMINTLLVGFLHMTSDYLIKPLLTVLFNGFLQPPLIFIYNVLSSVRDILMPVADTVNNFFKPIATVGKSVRLIHATYNSRSKKLIKDV